MSTETKQTLREILTGIAEDHGGNLTPEHVVEHARSKASPLHQHFEWNNTKAAAEYRMIQAGVLIRRVKVTYETKPEHHVTVRAFVNVRPSSETSTTERGSYVPFEQAVSNPEMRSQVLASAARDAQAFRSKYAALEEAQRVIDAIDEAFPIPPKDVKISDVRGILKGSDS